MKGGHAASGRAPDPNALRRDRASDAAGWTTLPAAGRPGPPPEWPLDDPTPRELHWWQHFWAKPQATEWERLGMVAEVAAYVRRFAEVERPGSPVALGTLVKQLGEQLGLTIPGMRMHRWKIGPKAVPAASQARSESERPARTSSRDRFRVIDGAAS